MTHLIQDFLLFMFIYGISGHFWAADFNLKVKMVSENIKTHSVTFLMPEIIVNDTLFESLSYLYQEMPLFGFQ